MIMGIVPPALLFAPPTRAAGFSVMNCVPSWRGATFMMVLGAAARIGTLAAALVVGMYVMGRNVVGQDWFPGEAVAATSWKFANCCGWSPVVAVVLMIVAFATSAGKLVTVVLLVVGFEACDDCWMGCGGIVAALT